MTGSDISCQHTIDDLLVLGLFFFTLHDGIQHCRELIILMYIGIQDMKFSVWPFETPRLPSCRPFNHKATF